MESCIFSSLLIRTSFLVSIYVFQKKGSVIKCISSSFSSLIRISFLVSVCVLQKKVYVESFTFSSFSSLIHTSSLASIYVFQKKVYVESCTFSSFSSLIRTSFLVSVYLGSGSPGNWQSGKQLPGIVPGFPDCQIPGLPDSRTALTAGKKLETQPLLLKCFYVGSVSIYVF